MSNPPLGPRRKGWTLTIHLFLPPVRPPPPPTSPETAPLGRKRFLFNLMFHIGVLSAFFADLDFMTFLQRAAGCCLLATSFLGQPPPPPHKSTPTAKAQGPNVPSLSPQSAAFYYWLGIWISNLLVVGRLSPCSSNPRLVTCSLNHGVI